MRGRGNPPPPDLVGGAEAEEGREEVDSPHYHRLYLGTEHPGRNLKTPPGPILPSPAEIFIIINTIIKILRKTLTWVENKHALLKVARYIHHFLFEQLLFLIIVCWKNMIDQEKGFKDIPL